MYIDTDSMQHWWSDWNTQQWRFLSTFYCHLHKIHLLANQPST